MEKIDRKHFKILYDAFLEKVKKDYAKSNNGEIPNDQQIFGRKGYNPKKGTARTFMYGNEKIKKYLREKYGQKGSNEKDWSTYINPKYLYTKKTANYDKDDLPITIGDPYNVIVPLYIGGFEDLDTFIKAKGEKVEWIEYTGFYYSFLRHEIRKYFVGIKYDIQKSDDQYSREKYEVWEQGFHDDNTNPKYNGYAYKLGGKLHLVLDRTRGSKSKILIDKLKMIFDSGGNPETHDVMKGSILAVSAAQIGNPLLNTETVLIKNEYINKHSSDKKVALTLLNVERYLHLHRCHFWIRPQKINLERMVIKRDISVDQLSHLIGIYRVWRFDEDYNIVQSKLIIKENYESYCHNRVYGKSIFDKQVCLLRINNHSELASKTICISTHPNIGTGIISYIILKFIEEFKWKKLHNDNKLLGGTISFVKHGDDYPNLRAIAMKWEGGIDSEDDINFPLGIFSINTIQEKSKNFDALLNLLMNLTKRNLPPHDL